MIRYLLGKMLDRFEKQNGYNVDYARFLLKQSLNAFWQYARLQGISQYREEIPLDVYYAAKITAALHADCGPCVQLVVGWAEQEGIAPAVLRAIIARDFAALPADAALGVRYALAVLAHEPAADGFRESIRTKWGDEAVISVAYAVVSGQIYPNLKYALGYAHTCQQVTVQGAAVPVTH